MYKSSGDFVTGEPVNILRYFARSPIFKIFFVRFAVGLLIVVDSSIPIKALPLNMLRKECAKSSPFDVEMLLRSLSIS